MATLSTARLPSDLLECGSKSRTRETRRQGPVYFVCIDPIIWRDVMVLKEGPGEETFPHGSAGGQKAMSQPP